MRYTTERLRSIRIPGFFNLFITKLGVPCFSFTHVMTLFWFVLVL